MALITITGPSGAGKDTFARMLSDLTGIPIVVSYTTRPMREGEEQGREHHFVERCDVPNGLMLAYTNYGGYEYWTTFDQLADNTIYVIDEAGLVNMRQRFPMLELTTVYITASKRVRMARGVTAERIKRDELRHLTFPPEQYDYCIGNDMGMRALEVYAKALIKKQIPNNYPILHQPRGDTP